MSRKAFVPVVAAGLAMAGIGSATAATMDKSEQSEIGGVRIAQVAPADAIHTAEQKTGGHALGFGYEVNAKVNAYEVTVTANQGLKMVRIDPKTGQVTAVEAQDSNALAGDGLPASSVDSAATAQTRLADAVGSVEQMTGGRALEASYVLVKGKLGIDIDIAHEGGIASFVVDASNGKVYQLARSEDEGAEGAEGPEQGDAD